MNPEAQIVRLAQASGGANREPAECGIHAAGGSIIPSIPRRFVQLATAAGCTCLLAACRQGTEPTPRNQNGIGPAGGVVTSPTGEQVTIPAGAFSGNTPV